MFGTTKQFLDYFGLKKLDDLPPLADLSDWETLRVQLNLPAVEEDEAPAETADITELPVLPSEEEDDIDEDDDFDLDDIPELIADTGFQEIVATKWPDPRGGDDDEPEPAEAGEGDDLEKTRSGT
jgi:segregation and condensation protein B